MRWRWPADSTIPPSPMSVRIAAGQLLDHRVHAGCARGRRDRRLASRADRSARCCRRSFLRTARCPAADSRCGGRARRASHCASALPSRRTLPALRLPGADERARERRLARRARADDAEPGAGRQAKADARGRRGPLAPGGATVRRSTLRLRCGCWRRAAAARPPRGSRQRAPRAARSAWRAATKLRQWAIAVSTGASARDRMMEAAIIVPADAFAVDHQIGAEPEHARLQRRARHLDRGADAVATARVARTARRDAGR